MDLSVEIFSIIVAVTCVIEVGVFFSLSASHSTKTLTYFQSNLNGCPTKSLILNCCH